MSRLVQFAVFSLLAACGGDSDADSDAASTSAADASGASTADAASATFDASPAAPDAQAAEPDAASGERTTLLPGFCPSTVTAPGLYEGTLGGNLNDVSGCDGLLAAPGRDGAVRLELAAGATVSATLRHDGDGVAYILDRCPVTSSCLDRSDSSLSGPESVTYTNDTGDTNTVYVVLDSDDVAGPQTFEFDLTVTN